MLSQEAERIKLVQEIMRGVDEKPRSSLAKDMDMVAQKTLIPALGFEGRNIHSNCRIDGYELELLILRTKAGDPVGFVSTACGAVVDEALIKAIINNEDCNYEWHLVFTGTVLMVLNTRMESSNLSSNPMNTVVFSIPLDKKEDYWREFFPFLSNDCYKGKEINSLHYFKQVATFKSKYSNPKNINVYLSTLYSFFRFLAPQRPYSDKVLGTIGMRDFYDFIHYKQKRLGKELAKSTIRANYSHFSSFFKTLGIENTAFSNDREGKLDIFKDTDQKQLKPQFCRETIAEVLTCLDKKQQKARQDMCLFYLFAYIGMERAVALKLTWGDYCQKKKTLRVVEREIPLSSELSRALTMLKNEATDKTGSIFTVNYRGEKPLTVAAVVSLFQRISAERGNYGGISAQYMRTEAVLFLFREGFFLEEISYLTNVEVPNLQSYISKEEITEIGGKRLRRTLKDKGHPLDGLLAPHLKER